MLDEIQFAPTNDILLFVVKYREYSIFACGLDLDWHQKPYETTAQLSAYALSVLKVTARCDYCGSPARYSLKKEYWLTHNDEKVCPFIPVCEKHYPIEQHYLLKQL